MVMPKEVQNEDSRSTSSTSSSMAKLSANEKEKMKLRERQRRAITTKQKRVVAGRAALWQNLLEFWRPGLQRP